VCWPSTGGAPYWQGVSLKRIGWAMTGAAPATGWGMVKTRPRSSASGESSAWPAERNSPQGTPARLQRSDQ
jgi:hypothetical protein